MYNIIKENRIDPVLKVLYNGGAYMIYSDVSCIVENTIKKFIDLKINNMLKIDFFALITITNYGKVIIDGNINYLNFNEGEILDILEKNSDDIFNLQSGTILNLSLNNKPFDIIAINVRAQDNYRVFGISCSFNQSYTERDLSIFEFIVKTTYENVLLDNEIVKERNYLQNLFESVKSFVVGIDIDGKITSANKVALDIFGNGKQELIGQDYETFLADEESYKLKKMIEYVIMKNKSYSTEENFFSSFGQGEILVNLSISPINDNKGEPVGVVILGNDITKQKIYEKEIEQLNQFAVLGELAAGVAHDIRNPLMSIRGCARVLEKKLVDLPSTKEFTEPIIYEVDRINEKIMQMLSYSFITQEDMYSMVDINEVLEKCVNILSFHKESKYIDIEKKFFKELPLIKGNTTQMHQVFLNILFNAVQAIESGGSIVVETQKLEKEKKVVVKIIDNGKGIDIDKIDQIFNPFFTTKNDGTGLGLSIVKRVIEKYDGELVVNSKVDEGTEFKIYLPY